MLRKWMIILLVGLGLGFYVVSMARRAARVLTAQVPPGFGLILEDCPKCGRQVVLSPGKETRCASCGEHLAVCEGGETLKAEEVAAHVPGTPWLCAKHREETDWEAARLHEFKTKEALTPPTETPRAVAARRHYESRVREAHARKKDAEAELFPFEKRQRPDSSKDAKQVWPRSVVEAYRFYERAVMERDNGSVGIFPWDLEGSPLYVVMCDTDGSDGFLELYDADGSVLGYARTSALCPVWTSRGVVRRRTFLGDRDEVDARLPEAEKRLKGQRP